MLWRYTFWALWLALLGSGAATAANSRSSAYCETQLRADSGHFAFVHGSLDRMFVKGEGQRYFQIQTDQKMSVKPRLWIGHLVDTVPGRPVASFTLRFNNAGTRILEFSFGLSKFDPARQNLFMALRQNFLRQLWPLLAPKTTFVEFVYHSSATQEEWRSNIAYSLKDTDKRRNRAFIGAAVVATALLKERPEGFAYSSRTPWIILPRLQSVSDLENFPAGPLFRDFAILHGVDSPYRLRTFLSAGPRLDEEEFLAAQKKAFAKLGEERHTFAMPEFEVPAKLMAQKNEREKQALADLQRVTDFTMPIFLQDKIEPAMLLIEPLDQAQQIEHEQKTAREYARYLSRRGEAFVYANTFEKKTVPFFDGFTVSTSQQPIANISLKSWQYRNQKTDWDTFRESMRIRLEKEDEEIKHLNLKSWFVISSQMGGFASFCREHTYSFRIQHARRLMELFGLKTDETARLPSSREFRLVLDMKKSGYPPDFFKTAEAREEINKLLPIVRSPLSLILLWDSEQVLEFRSPVN